MYLANYKREGVRQIVMATLDNFFSPQRIGFEVKVKVYKQSREIFFTFTGLPDLSTKRPGMERTPIRVMLEEMHACQCEDKGNPGVGAGLAVVNAFSKSLEWTDGKVSLLYKDGVLVKETQNNSATETAWMIVQPIDEIDFEAGV
jgi:hypothetical protein